MTKKNKAVQETAKENLADMLELDAQEQVATEEFEYEPSEDELVTLPIVAPVKVAPNNRASFLPREPVPQAIIWPTDIWGLTKDLKAALTSLSSRLAGSPDKKALFDETLKAGLAYLEVKYEADRSAREAAAKK